MRYISLCFFSSPILNFGFRFLWIHAAGLPRSSPLKLPLLSGNGFSVFCWHQTRNPCDEDDGEVGEGVVEEEFADKPGTTNGTQLDILQSILLPFLMRRGFWPLIQWYENPWSSESFPKQRTAGISSRSMTLTNKSNCLTYTVASSLVCTSPLAVTTVVGLLDVLMLSNSAEWKSFLLSISTLASWINYKPSFLQLFCGRSRDYPLLRGKV